MATEKEKEFDLNKEVDTLIRPHIARMKRNGLTKEQAVKLSGADWHTVDQVYNADKSKRREDE